MSAGKDIRNVPTDRLGAVGQNANGDTYVQFVRVLPFPAAAVWRAITEAQSLAAWFPGFRLEHREGGQFKMWFGDDCDGPAHVSGMVTAYDPPRLLECGTMRWELEETAGGCSLTFTDIVRFNQDQRGDFETTNAVLAGWHFYMDRLEDSLSGTLDPDDTIEYDYAAVPIPGRAAAD